MIWGFSPIENRRRLVHTKRKMNKYAHKQYSCLTDKIYSKYQGKAFLNARTTSNTLRKILKQ